MVGKEIRVTFVYQLWNDELIAHDSDAMTMSADALLLARLCSQQLDHQFLVARHRFEDVSESRFIPCRIHHHVVQNVAGRYRLDIERVVRDAQRGWGGKELDLKFDKLKNEFLFTKMCVPINVRYLVFKIKTTYPHISSNLMSGQWTE